MAKVDVLEERVTNHIKFFWVVVAFGFLWLGALTTLLVQTKSDVRGIAVAQGSVPAQIAAAVLNKVAPSPAEAQESLTAANAVLELANREKKKASPTVLKPLSEKLVALQDQYPQMAQVWQATGQFITYKSYSLISKAPQTGNVVDCTHNEEMSIEKGIVTFTNCEVGLSGLSVTGMPLVFSHCIVDYSGGSVPLTAMVFRDSLFRFHVTTVPPSRGIQAMRILAQADDLKSILIPG